MDERTGCGRRTTSSSSPHCRPRGRRPPRLRRRAARQVRHAGLPPPRDQANGRAARGPRRERLLQPEQTFEAGIAQAMAAVLASPRFLFREEALEADPGHAYPLVDEYALASRLSYFLWSSMPDEELFRLAARAQAAREPAGAGRADARRPAVRGVHQAVRRPVAAGSATSTPGSSTPAPCCRARIPTASATSCAQRFRELQRKDPDEMTDEEKKEFASVRDGSSAGGSAGSARPSSTATSAAPCGARPRCSSSTSSAKTAACWN